MNDLIFLRNLPLELLYIVTSYDPAVLFLFPRSDLLQLNWSRLLKLNFHKDYKNSPLTNEQLMRAYVNNFSGINKIICGMTEYFIINDACTVTLFDKSHNFNIKDFQRNISQIACGPSHTMILLLDGTLLCRGFNSNGQLGLKDICTRDNFVKNDTFGEHISIKQIACGSAHTLILLTNGTLLTCGDNSSGQLGSGPGSHRNFLRKVDTIARITQIACGYHHSFIKLEDGSIMSSGGNTSGQLGLRHTEVRYIFEKVEDIHGDISEIICGNCNTFLLMNDGTLMSCGYGKVGTLGHGDYESRTTFTLIEGLPKNIIKVQAGFDHVICLLGNGIIMTCGSNFSDELGFNDKINRNIFEEIKNLPPVENIGTGAFARYSIIDLLNGPLMRFGKFG
ncbi:MAG: chromosome condensation regulator [Harvfovirus sp.]|uniref:Chromosome condensation regulator n=1 Tax=Harvfovirus sp. TaxID=2487768 RepID=A0A3G5A2I9_9VIRU|nr:MAG: chromosome condensation regulator [Harvfovirus sp.]